MRKCQDKSSKDKDSTTASKGVENICGNAKCKLRKEGCRGFEGCPGFKLKRK